MNKRRATNYLAYLATLPLAGAVPFVMAGTAIGAVAHGTQDRNKPVVSAASQESLAASAGVIANRGPVTDDWCDGWVNGWGEGGWFNGWGEGNGCSLPGWIEGGAVPQVATTPETATEPLQTILSRA